MKVFFLLFASFTILPDSIVSAKLPTSVYSDGMDKIPKEFIQTSLSKKLLKDTPMVKLKSSYRYTNSLLLFNRICEEYRRFYGCFSKERRHYQTVSNFTESNIKLNQNNVRSRRAAFKLLSSLILSSDLIKDHKKWSRRLEKRNAVDADSSTKRNISKGRQKKIKALGRLLMNNVPNKNFDDTQDDYVYDDDYFKGTKRKKMNWEDYQNEDGASVMELIALNARHKTSIKDEYDDKYFY